MVQWFYLLRCQDMWWRGTLKSAQEFEITSSKTIAAPASSSDDELAARPLVTLDITCHKQNNDHS